MQRQLFLLGFATCQLPLFIAVALGWWSPWAGVGVGIAVSVTAAALWSRRAGNALFILGAFAGVGFAVMGASLVVPSLRMLVGAAPGYRLGTPIETGGGTPMAVNVYAIEGGAPRADLVYVGDVFETRGEAGVSYLYSVVAPIVAPDWSKPTPVPAWVICEVARRDDGEQAAAEKECIALIKEARIYEHETFDADLPNGPMVQAAMAQHGLEQADGAPIFVLHEPEHGLKGLLIPLVFLLLSLGALSNVAKKAAADDEPEP